MSLKTEKNKKKITAGDAGDRTRGLSHAKRTRYHCATSPDMKTCPEKALIKSLEEVLHSSVYFQLERNFVFHSCNKNIC